MRGFVAICLLLPAAAWADAPLDAVEWEFLGIINQYRADNGLECLTPSPTLNEAADYMSRTMGEEDFFSHSEPPCEDARGGEATRTRCSGREPGDRVRDFNHPGRFTGENIAAGHLSAHEVFEGWRNSPGHNANMLRPEYRAIGIGRVEVPGAAYRMYWTNNFSATVDGDYERCDGSAPGTGGSGPGTGGGSGGTGGASGGEGGRGGNDSGFWDKVSKDEDKGGCSSAGGAAGGLSLLAALLWLRRRPLRV